MTNEVLARSRILTISAVIMIKRFKWFDHVLRMNDDRLAFQALNWEPTEKKTVMLKVLQEVSAKRGWINLRRTAQRTT